MENINNVRKLTRASMLLVFALTIIFIGSRFGGATFNSFVVGPLVNAVIILAAMLTDMKFGILVSISTPILAALTGQLAAPMVPFVPFIMLGNATLAVTFRLFHSWFKTYGRYIGILVGAVLKTAFLVLSVNYLVTVFNLNIPKPIISKLAVVMSYPQLYSAIAGGAVALVFYTIFKRVNFKSE